MIKGVIYCVVSTSYSPIKGNDVSQQQPPVVVWKLTIEEEVLAIQEVWRIDNICFFIPQLGNCRHGGEKAKREMTLTNTQARFVAFNKGK